MKFEIAYAKVLLVWLTVIMDLTFWNFAFPLIVVAVIMMVVIITCVFGWAAYFKLKELRSQRVRLTSRDEVMAEPTMTIVTPYSGMVDEPPVLVLNGEKTAACIPIVPTD